MKTHSKWAAPGDVNAFFGLMLDNVADMLLMVGLMVGIFGFPENFALRYMIPGTAIGVLIGDLLFFLLALRLVAKTGRNDITAMPLGLDTPSTFGMVFFVLGPSYIAGLKNFSGDTSAAAMYTWQIGICSIFLSGVFKLLCALASNFFHNLIPRAGLLGSLAAIAAVVISFLPLLEILHYPLVGMLSIAIILTTLVAKVKTPLHFPGALLALLLGGGIYWFMQLLNYQGEMSPETIKAWQSAREGLMPQDWLTVFQFGWLSVMQDALNYLPVVLPLALATVVGGIDCAESAASVGDKYETKWVIGIEAFATLVAALCGGVIQTTPYIGHPAYKAMGGRSASALATALFIGLMGVTGCFSYLYLIIPKATVFPILVFIGLEITAQSFAATPRKHFAAVALALVPALAALVTITAGKFQLDISKLPPALQEEFLTITMLNNGFIITSLLWASSLAFLIDKALLKSACCYAIAAGLTFFGIIHSPLSSGAVFLPWELESHFREPVYAWSLAYLCCALLLSLWAWWLNNTTADDSIEEQA